MNFNHRLLVAFVAPTALFVASLAGSIVAMSQTRTAFDRYIQTEQVIANGVQEMYAQGLQSGQALRNVLLDPANPLAFKNLETARQAFQQVYGSTLETARGTSAEAGLLPLEALRADLSKAQDKVLALAKTDPAKATELLVQEETPAWRKLRGDLLALGEAARKLSAQTHATVGERADQARWIAIGLALLAMTAAALLGMVVHRTLRREIGGEPSLARTLLRQIADGDLSGTPPSARDPDSLMGALAVMQTSMRALVTQVHHSSASIHVGCSEIATGNQDLANRTELAASHLQQTASALEQLTGNVRQSADAAAQANQLAASASSVAQRGGAVVSQVVSTMDQINHSSKRIADIIGTIDGIAFQTNILALNAAVEAARAGEQGRGFAVVASEVRSLAQRSAEAAREIKTLIGTSVDKVEAGARLVQDAGTTMGEIVTSVQRVSDVIAEITAAAGEQSSGIGQVNGAISSLDQMTQQNAALVEESAAAAESLRDQAQRLGQAMQVFRLTDHAGAGGSALAVAAPVTVAAAPKRPALVAVTARKVAPAALARPAAPAHRPPELAQAAISQARETSRPSPPAASDDWESF